MSTDEGGEDKLFKRLKAVRSTPAERARHAQELAGLVRGRPIDAWPKSWSLDQALAAAMWLGLEPEGLAYRLKRLGHQANAAT